MYTRILNIWSNFRASFWFIPTLFLVASIVAAFGMIAFDKHYGSTIVQRLPILEMSPPAARSILSSIVSAMVSTTGVVFSITIVALSLSSSQFGSRLIRTYRKRKTTHYTLGIFVSTSLFCILVMASIRELEAIQFVPSTSVAMGILLSTLCLAMLVYYIHDMSRAIEAPNVIQRSALDLHDAINRLFPESIGQERADSRDGCKSSEISTPDGTEFNVGVDVVGYLQAIENETVMAIAKEYELTIKLLVRPGDFLFEGSIVAKVFPVHDDKFYEYFENPDDAVEKVSKELTGSLIVGPERTHIQDVLYAFEEVVDIAVRALSAGINDPFTAINCIDRIQAALMLLRTREIPKGQRFDNGGNLRVIAKPVELEECIQASLGVIHNYASDSPIVLRRIEAVMDRLEESGESIGLN